jgi:hypothetical protein
MMPEMNAAMFAVSSSPVVAVLAKITVSTALGLLAARLLRGSRASVRHAILAATFGALLLIPAATVVAPPIRFAVSITGQSHSLPVPLPIAIGANLQVPVTSPVTPASRAWRPSLFDLLLAMWVAGAVLFLLQLVTGLWQVRSMRRSGIAWTHGQSVAN